MYLTKREKDMLKATEQGKDAVHNRSGMPEEYKEMSHLRQAWEQGYKVELDDCIAWGHYIDRIGR